jgi:hypothetical protein
MGWATEGSELMSRQGQEFSVLDIIQIGSGAHTASYPTGTGVSFAAGKAAGAWSWLLNANQSRSKDNVDLYIHSPRRRHGVVLN